ncbi:1-acyl-sn-glycerol-3-phosphate acyltransferase [Leeuwenhoekiella aequorea]|uniref:1-acyl-sn-glycerol-3-phosphate acyltransferase n=1 Tax=Leeuwenhoekiella aequorea TaxID=283736 RepID=A0A4Q0PCC1_9FLAO|nr:1-acyl-sn-glycerol-3-phosphate acyltransferase [Leeuwenhoekiella aequorea]RXG23649.1 1-acyl-sn-glycerol-3-phosphate acyltransferase [Leeuwenhoekiella aequorea]
MGWISKRLYNALGWRIRGSFPSSVKKMIVIAVPHTSWHDFYMGLIFRSVLDEEINFLGKKELFKWPLGIFFRSLGGTPLNRVKGQNQVEQISALFAKKDIFRLALSPEGTRRKVDTWKTGFYYIALKAQVPILPVTMNFKDKEHHIGNLFYPTGDITKDMIELRSFFKNIKGKVPENS